MTTMPALYEISRDYMQAMDVLTDPDNDIPMDAVADTLEGIEGQLQEKATNVAMVMRNLESAADAIKDAEQRMARRRKAIENRAQWLKNYIKRNMEVAGITRIESPWFVLSVQKNPAAVDIADEAMLPDTFKHEVTTVKVDKAAIKDALKAGQEVPGAVLVVGTRLMIR